MKWARSILIGAVTIASLLAAGPVSAREPLTAESAAKAIIQVESRAAREAEQADAAQAADLTESPTSPTDDEFDPAAVIDAATAAIADHPSNAYAHVFRAIGHAGQNDLRSALSDVNAALQLDPGLAEAYTVRGLIHQEQGNHEQAVNDLTLVTQIPPQSANAYRLRGASHANLGNYAAALADFNRAIELDPGDADAYYNRAVLYQFALGQESNALQDYNRVIELVPSALAALNNRAILLTLRGQHEAALADMAAYARHNDNVLPPHVLDTRGYIHLRRGAYASAIADYQAALDGGLSPVYPTLGMGIAYAQLGNLERAIPLLEAGLARIQGAGDMDGQLTDLVRRANAILSAQ